MKAELVAQADLHVGEPMAVQGDSPTGKFSAVFEDDGETGYFYALDLQRAEPIVDAVAIYSTEGVADGDRPSVLQIAWSTDGTKALLLINSFPHAVFDFEQQRGYCRTGFPPPVGEWSNAGHDWSDDALKLFE